MMLKSKVQFFFLILMLGFVESCNPETDYVPYVPVSYTLDVINQLNIGINETAIITRYDAATSKVEYPNNPTRPATYIPYKTYGNGVVIVKLFDGYAAYDLTCPYRANEDYCATEYDAELVTNYTCPCCETTFNLVLDAYPEGDTKTSLPLKKYNSTEYGNDLLISN